MRGKLSGVALLAALAMLAVGAGFSQARTRGHEGKKFTCSLTVYSQTPTSLTGFDFGLVSCTKRFGNGVQYNTYTESVTPPTASARGPFTWFFNDGTVHGVFRFAGTFTSPTTGAFVGTFEITGGTGVFRHVKAHGDLNVMTANGGQTFTGTATGRATRF